MRRVRVSLRLALLSTVLVLAGSAALWQFLSTSTPGGLRFAAPEKAALERRSTLAEALEQNRARYRLTPDRRFVRAFADAAAIASGRLRAAIHVEWRDDAWTLESGDAVLGRIPLLASFEEQLQPLTDYAARTLSPRSLPPVSLRRSASKTPRADFYASDELLKASEAWNAGRRDARVALSAARALGWMLLQSADQLELSDALVSRALAALAVARALDPTAGRREECLVSYAAGYSGHARTLAQRLEQDDPLRAFVLRDEAALVALAERRDDFETHFLALLRAGELNFDDKWQDALRGKWLAARGGDYRAVAFGTAFSGERTMQRMVAAPGVVLLTSAWTGESPGEKSDVTWALSRAARVEGEVARAAADVDAGPFFDSEIFTSAHESLYFTFLRGALLEPLEFGYGTKEMRRLLEAVPATEKSKLRELRDWYELRVAKLEGADTRAGQAMAVDRERFLGTPMRAALLVDLDWSPPLGDDNRAARARGAEFISTLDARPAHRALAARLARGRSRDVLRGDALESSLVRDDSPRHERERVKLILRHGGVDALERALATADSPWETAYFGVNELAQNSRDDVARTLRFFAKLWDESRHADWLYWRYRLLLIERVEDWKAAETLARTRLERSGKEADRDEAAVRSDLARALRRQDRPYEALQAIECCTEKFDTEAPFQAVLALLKLGRVDEADALATRATRAIQNPLRFELALAEVDWRRGNYEAAARRITPPARTLERSYFRDHVAWRMSGAFENRPIEELLVAFDTLVRLDAQNGQDGRVEDLAAHFLAIGRPEVAFAMQERLARFNFALWKNRDAEPLYEPMSAVLASDRGRARSLALAWRALVAWKGEEAANAWILGLRAKPFRWQMAPNFYSGGAPELLWIAYPENPPPSYVSLMRAHALAANPALAERHPESHRAELASATSEAEGSFARVALGIDRESALLDKPLTAPELCQTAFYLGLAAQGRGELARAAEWYQIVLDTQLVTFNTYAYADQQLEAWRKSDQGFEVAPRWDDPVNPRLAGLR